MDGEKAIPKAIAQYDIVKKLEKLNADAAESTNRLNEISADYRVTVASVYDKIMLLSLGSASVLFTFIGVLFGSNKSTASLEFKYAIFALVCFLIVPALLLASRIIQSLFVFSLGQKYYLQSLKAVREGEMLLLKLGNNFMNTQYVQMTQDQIDTKIKIIDKSIKKINKQIEEDKKKEKRRNDFSKWLPCIAYCVLILAYIFVLVFFIGVIDIMNDIK